MPSRLSIASAAAGQEIATGSLEMQCQLCEETRRCVWETCRGKLHWQVGACRLPEQHCAAGHEPADSRNRRLHG